MRAEVGGVDLPRRSLEGGEVADVRNDRSGVVGAVGAVGAVAALLAALDECDLAVGFADVRNAEPAAGETSRADWMGRQTGSLRVANGTPHIEQSALAVP